MVVACDSDDLEHVEVMSQGTRTWKSPAVILAEVGSLVALKSEYHPTHQLSNEDHRF